MAKLLTRLKISEVSAVDRGAGEDCRILLRKRDQDAVAKAVEALETSVGLILGSDGSEEEKRQELVETFTQFQTYLDRNVAGSEALSKGPLERAERRTREAFAKIFAGKADDVSDDPIRASVSDHHASKVADLLVEAGSHPDRSAALSYLLHSSHGAALLGRISKAAETAKESHIMDHQELASVIKADGGLQALCKRVITDGAGGISENDFVSAVTDLARERFADLPGDIGFAKLYEADAMLRKALRVVRDSAWGYAAR
jgi:hypothetical protein